MSGSTTPPRRVWRAGKWYSIIELEDHDSDGIVINGNEVTLANGFTWAPNNWFAQQKLADLAMAFNEVAVEGVHYVLNSMPRGYRTAVHDRGFRIDRYFYGHPSGRPFRGSPQLMKHITHININGREQGDEPCDCELCVRQRNEGQA